MTPYVSSGAFGASKLEALLGEAANTGIYRLELSSGLRARRSTLNDLAEDSRGFSFLVHNYFPAPEDPFTLNLASQNPSTRERSLDLARDGIEIAARLGAPYYSVHAGFAIEFEPALLGHPEKQVRLPDEAYIPRDIAYVLFRDAVDMLSSKARELGVEVLIENNVVSPLWTQNRDHHPLFLAHPEGIHRFLKEVDSPNVGLLLDVGHLHVTANTLEFDPVGAFRELAPMARLLHLSDNDGTQDTNDPVLPSSWFLPLLEEAQDAEAVLEAYQLEPHQIRRQRALIADHLESSRSPSS